MTDSILLSGFYIYLYAPKIEVQTTSNGSLGRNHYKALHNVFGFNLHLKNV